MNTQEISQALHLHVPPRQVYASIHLPGHVVRSHFEVVAVRPEGGLFVLDLHEIDTPPAYDERESNP